MKGYVAGEAYWRYPAEGAGMPPSSAKVLLLTKGGICIVGMWKPGDTDLLAWSPLPKRKE